MRKAYDSPGKAQPGDIWLPTLSDLWHEQTGAWVGQVGYQVWHLGMMGYGGRERPADDLPVGVFWDEDGTATWQPHNPELYRLPASMPAPETYQRYLDEFDDPGWDAQFAPVGRQSPCCRPPIVRYQGDVIEAAFDSEPIGEGATSLLATTYKSPDYTGHVYGMGSKWTGLQLRAVDEQLGRLKAMLDERFPDEYALIVTADHGQCPLPDSVGGVRLDPIQLERFIESRFSGVTGVVESVVPSEVFLNVSRLADNGGATIEDVAASLADYRYRQNIGPYVPRSAVEQDLLDQKEFAAVFGTTFLESLAGRDLAGYGDTAYADGDPGGLPTTARVGAHAAPARAAITCDRAPSCQRNSRPSRTSTRPSPRMASATPCTPKRATSVGSRERSAISALSATLSRAVVIDLEHDRSLIGGYLGRRTEGPGQVVRCPIDDVGCRHAGPQVEPRAVPMQVDRTHPTDRERCRRDRWRVVRRARDDRASRELDVDVQPQHRGVDRRFERPSHGRQAHHPRSTHSCRCGASSPTVVESPCPGCTSVCGGITRMRLRMDAMITSKSPSSSPVDPGPPGNRVSPANST